MLLRHKHSHPPSDLLLHGPRIRFVLELEVFDLYHISRMKAKNFRKRSRETDDGDEDNERRLSLALEEVKFLQRQRERKSGIPALPTQAPSAAAGGGATKSNPSGSARNVNDKAEADVEKDDLVLQDTFAQETAVMEEDPNMLRYVEQELAKRKGKRIDVENQVQNDVMHVEDELYKIPEHLKVKKRSSKENSTQWTTGIAEVQLPIEYKLRNIEETEAAKKLLQEKRSVGRAKEESSLPSSFSADFFQRGRDYAEKLKKGNPPFYKAEGGDDNGLGSRHTESVLDTASRRQVATDEFMLERFRKRERQRLTR